MALLRQSAEHIRNVVVARLKGYRDSIKLDLSSYVPFWRIINAFAQEMEALVGAYVSASAGVVPTRSRGVPLRQQAMDRGVMPLAATKWKGFVRLEAAPGSAPALGAGCDLVAGDGTGYTTEMVLPTDWVDGSVVVAAEGIMAGSKANKADGTALTVTTIIAGLLLTACLDSTTTEGTDAETDTELADRLGEELADVAPAGDCADYVAWAKEAMRLNYGGQAGEATNAACYPRWDNAGAVVGTMTIAIWGPSLPLASVRQVSAACVADIQAYIDLQRPVGVDLTVESIVAAHHPLGLEVTVEPKPGYGPDWVVPPGDIHVVSVDPGSLRVFIDVDPRAIIFPGHRVVFYCGITGTTEEMKVASLGVDHITLAEWPESGDPVTPFHVLPGGRLWGPIRDAILAVHDVLGPASSDDPTRPRFPAESEGLPSTVYLAQLNAAVCGVDGVASCTWGTPAANVTLDETPGDPITMRVMAPSTTIYFTTP